MKMLLNGTLYEQTEAVVSVFDHGFLYGIGLFETFRTYAGVPFLLKEHLARLEQGCQALAIDFHLNEAQIKGYIHELLEVNELTEGYFRLTVSAGEDELGLPLQPYVRPNVLLYVKGLPPRDEQLYTAGRGLQLLRLRRNSPEGDVRLKSFHYMNNIMAKREMAFYPWAVGAEGLFLNKAEQLAEGIVSNVFFIRNGKCFTPSIETGILPGITRAYVIRLLQKLQIPIREGFFGWGELLSADEIFVTNSIQEVVPIHTLYDPEGHSWDVSDGKAGPYTRKIIQLYSE
jgi:4-amino-4-deoxychorismate lyase